MPDGRRTDWAGVALGLAVASLAAFQMLKLAPALPVLIADYGYDRVLAGAMMSVYAAAALVLSLAAGGLLARRPVATLGGGLACMVVGNVATLIAPDSGAVVLVARGIEGIGYAVFGIAGPVIANRSAAEHHFPIVAGIVAIWVPVGQITALVAAQLTLDSHGWRPLWWLSLLLTAAVGLWMVLRRDDVIAAMSAIRRAGEARWSGRETAALWLAAAVFALWGGQYIAFMTWLPDHMVDRHGLTPQHAALLNMVPVLGVAVSCLITGWVLRKVPFGALFVIATMSQVPVWLFAGDLPDAWGLAAIAFFGLACGVTPTLLFALPPRLLGRDRVSPAAFAPMMTGRNCGILAAPVVAGWLVTGWGWDAMGPVFGAVTFLAAAGGGVMAWLAAKRR